MIQLSPAIPIMTPKGEGIAHFLIDYGIEDNLYWVCFITETGECWTFGNPEIRACNNITLGRTMEKVEKPNRHTHPLPNYAYCQNT